MYTLTFSHTGCTCQHKTVVMASTGIPEEIIKELGGCGRYQIILGFVMHAMKTSVVWSMYTMIFAAATPKWWCSDDATSDVTSGLNFSYSVQNTSNATHELHSFSLYKSCVNRNGDACRNIVYDYSIRTIYNEVCTFLPNLCSQSVAYRP